MLHRPRHARALEPGLARVRLAGLSAVRPWVPAVPAVPSGAPPMSAGRLRPEDPPHGAALPGDDASARGDEAGPDDTALPDMGPRRPLLRALVDGAADRVPPRVRAAAGAAALRPAHAAVLSLVALAALAAAVLLVVAGRPRSEPVPTSVGLLATAAPTTPAAAASGAAAAPSGMAPSGMAQAVSSPGAAVPRPGVAGSGPALVVVDVAGRVRHPGVVRLPAGSRVIDALRAAGGARAGTDLTTLNLARVLVDGEQVAVGVQAAPPLAAAGPGGAAPGSGTAGGGTGPVDLNTATLEQLVALPGVGPVLAQRILDWRAEHGRFNSVDELTEVSGIGDARLADLQPLVTV